ncbi:MAG TPA: ribonuclease H-like YkuK family protein, partial [Saprospiraceae bacterium]|nr:ribonuclease H-like YkuK family protein [Saprospiraceae bacterium]
MMREQHSGWRKLNGDPVPEPIVQTVERTIRMEQEAGYRLKLCIGTDSQTRGDHVDFATVIVFLREGRGGFMFIRNSSYKGDLKLKERMITEVAKSIEVAYDLCDILEQYDIGLE